MLIQGFISQICVQWEQRVGTQIVDFPIFEQSSQLSNFEKVYYIGIESNMFYICVKCLKPKGC